MIGIIPAFADGRILKQSITRRGRPRRLSSYEKASQQVRCDGLRFSMFLVRPALIRTLNGSAFDPVHVRVRRGVLLSMDRTLDGAKHCSGPSFSPQSPGRNVKEHLKSVVYHSPLTCFTERSNDSTDDLPSMPPYSDGAAAGRAARKPHWISRVDASALLVS